MKRLFVILTLCALVLTGCAASAGEPVQAPSEGGASAERTEAARELELLEPVFSAEYSNLTPYNRIKQGYETGRESVYYLDVATATERRIGDEPSEQMNYFWLYASQDSLFWVNSGAPNEEGSIYISASGLDGSNMRAIMTYDDYPVGEKGLLFSDMWYDGENLYVFVTEDLGHDKPQNEDGSYPTDVVHAIAKSIHKIDAANGGLVAEFPIYTGESDAINPNVVSEQRFFSGVYNNEMLFETKRRATAEERDASGNSFVNLGYYTISPADGARTDLDGMPEITPMRTAYNDSYYELAERYGVVYVCDVETRALYKTYVASGARSDVTALPAECGFIFGEQTIDEYLIIRTRRDTSADYDSAYAVNMDTGEITELTLKCMYDASVMQPLFAYEVSGDELCVKLETRFETVNYAFSGGVGSQEVAYNPWAIMTKADYFSNTPNFREITEAE